MLRAIFTKRGNKKGTPVTPSTETDTLAVMPEEKATSASPPAFTEPMLTVPELDSESHILPSVTIVRAAGIPGITLPDVVITPAVDDEEVHMAKSSPVMNSHAGPIPMTLEAALQAVHVPEASR